MPDMYETGQLVPFTTLPLVEELTNEYATDRTTIVLKVRRASDGFVMDWGAAGGFTFVDPTGAVVQLGQQLVEFGPTFPGEYTYTLDLSTVTNVVDYDAYYITAVDADPESLVANLPQVGQFRVVPALDDATLGRKALYNNQSVQPGDSNNFVLKDDDGVTTLATWNAKDPGGLSITISPGAPAIRERTS